MSNLKLKLLPLKLIFVNILFFSNAENLKNHGDEYFKGELVDYMKSLRILSDEPYSYFGRRKSEYENLLNEFNDFVYRNPDGADVNDTEFKNLILLGNLPQNIAKTIENEIPAPFIKSTIPLNNNDKSNKNKGFLEEKVFSTMDKSSLSSLGKGLKVTGTLLQAVDSESDTFGASLKNIGQRMSDQSEIPEDNSVRYINGLTGLPCSASSDKKWCFPEVTTSTSTLPPSLWELRKFKKQKDELENELNKTKAFVENFGKANYNFVNVDENQNEFILDQNFDSLDEQAPESEDSLESEIEEIQKPNNQINRGSQSSNIYIPIKKDYHTKPQKNRNSNIKKEIYEHIDVLKEKSDAIIMSKESELEYFPMHKDYQQVLKLGDIIPKKYLNTGESDEISLPDHIPEIPQSEDELLKQERQQKKYETRLGRYNANAAGLTYAEELRKSKYLASYKADYSAVTDENFLAKIYKENHEQKKSERNQKAQENDIKYYFEKLDQK